MSKVTGLIKRNGSGFLGCRCAAVLAGLILVFTLEAYSAQQENLDGMQTSFSVKYVSVDAVYLEGGSDSGLAPGQKLVIAREGADRPVVAQIEIESVTPASAVGRIVSGGGNIARGDSASFAQDEIEKLKRNLAATAEVNYPQIISFTEDDDPLDREVREFLPRPRLPEINRMRGRIGFDSGFMEQAGRPASSLYGLSLRIDASRLGGTYWNLRGYYRGYRHSRGGDSQTPMLVDLINRTYHLNLTYDNPNSRWVAGFGRMLVPWASSLDTLDGFYLGRRIGIATTGVFGGSAPDPTSWDYAPNRRMAGGFVNFESGSFESLRFTSTSGIALTRINWSPDRQFGFFQNGIFYKRYVSVYSDVQVDLLDGPSAAVDGAQSPGKRELALSRSYFTLRLQPLRMLSFDISENYFRNIPTFDERLLSTGLLDKYLFQGLSGGFRIELPLKLGLYSTVGRSSRSGDAKASWDYMAGVTVGDLFRTGMRADVKYSRFDSSFGRGTYKSLMLAREVGEGLQFDLQIGQQDVLSAFTSRNRSRFINGNLNWLVGANYYVGIGMTLHRGTGENYRQWVGTLGYRFDNRRKRAE